MRKGPRGRGDSAKVPVFDILKRRGIVKVEVVPNVTAETNNYLPLLFAKTVLSLREESPITCRSRASIAGRIRSRSQCSLA